MDIWFIWKEFLLGKKLLHKILHFVVASLSYALCLIADNSGVEAKQLAQIEPQELCSEVISYLHWGSLTFSLSNPCLPSNRTPAIVLLLPFLFVTNLVSRHFRISFISLMSKCYPTCALLLYHEDKTIKLVPAVGINKWIASVCFTTFCPTWNLPGFPHENILYKMFHVNLLFHLWISKTKDKRFENQQWFDHSISIQNVQININNNCWLDTWYRTFNADC